MEIQEISVEMLGRLVAYQTAMAEYKKAFDETLKANEAAITPIAERYYGKYPLYVINYAVLALQEPEDGDEEYDFDFGEKGTRKATVDRYDGYSFTDTPDKDGYYQCIEQGHHRWQAETVQVKFHQISKIEKRIVELGGDKDGQWMFPYVEVPYANVSKFGNGRMASVYYDPRQIDRKVLKAELEAVIAPMPQEPKYQDFGITDEEYRALRTLAR